MRFVLNFSTLTHYLFYDPEKANLEDDCRRLSSQMKFTNNNEYEATIKVNSNK